MLNRPLAQQIRAQADPVFIAYLPADVMPSWSEISVAVLAQAANPPSDDKQFVRDWLEAAYQRQVLGHDAANAAFTARRDCQNGGQTPGSAGAPDRLTG